MSAIVFKVSRRGAEGFFFTVPVTNERNEVVGRVYVSAVEVEDGASNALLNADPLSTVVILNSIPMKGDGQ